MAGTRPHLLKSTQCCESCTQQPNHWTQQHSALGALCREGKGGRRAPCRLLPLPSLRPPYSPGVQPTVCAGCHLKSVPGVCAVQPQLQEVCGELLLQAYMVCLCAVDCNTLATIRRLVLQVRCSRQAAEVGGECFSVRRVDHHTPGCVVPGGTGAPRSYQGAGCAVPPLLRVCSVYCW